MHTAQYMPDEPESAYRQDIELPKRATDSHNAQHAMCKCILASFAQQKHAQQVSHTRMLHPAESMLSTMCTHACWRDSLALRCRATRKSMWKYWFTVSVSKVLLAPRATARPSPVPANQVVSLLGQITFDRIDSS